jgi:hypothetical protein
MDRLRPDLAEAETQKRESHISVRSRFNIPNDRAPVPVNGKFSVRKNSE